MRTSPRARRLRLITAAAILVTWLCPGAGQVGAAAPAGREPAAATARIDPVRRAGGQPGTAEEAARYAERERQDGSLAKFEGGSRISTTTLIIILLLVIIVLLLI
jgi:hypothetical protein